MAVIGRNQLDQGGAAAEKVRQAVQAFMRRGKPASGRPAPGRGRPPKQVAKVILAVEVGLVILIGLLVGRMAINLLSPLPAADDPPPPPRAPAEAAARPANPFRAAAAPEMAPGAPAGPATAETTLDLTLHGAWVEEGGRSSAIIRTPDNEQKIFFVGDTICCGARLEEVYPEEVIISRGGVRESLRLANRQESPRSSAPARQEAAPGRQQSAPAAPTPDQEDAASSIANIVRLQPMRAPDGGFRLVVYPAADEAAFEASGFRSGDVVVSINNRPSPGTLADLNKLLQLMSDASEAVIVVDRGGAQVPIEIKAGERAPVPSQ